MQFNMNWKLKHHGTWYNHWKWFWIKISLVLFTNAFTLDIGCQYLFLLFQSILSYSLEIKGPGYKMIFHNSKKYFISQIDSINFVCTKLHLICARGAVISLMQRCVLGGVPCSLLFIPYKIQVFLFLLCRTQSFWGEMYQLCFAEPF